MKLFEIFGVVNVDTKAAKKGLADVDKKAADVGGSLSKLSKGAANMGKKFSSVGKKITSVGTGMTKGITAPIAALGASVLGLANNASNMADEIHKGSQRMGVSMKNYQELDYWASQNGLSHDSMERAVGRLNQRMGLAADGNEKYSEALSRLGVDMSKVSDGTLSTEDAFAQSIQTLSQMTSEQEKSALASELFGTKLARDLLPALQDGSLSLEDAKKKAQELGIVLSDDSILAGVAFQDAMDGVKRSLSTAFAQLGLKLIPLIQDTFLPLIQDTIIPMIKNFAETIGGLVEKFQSLSPGTQEMIIKAIGLVAVLGPAIVIIGKIVTVVGSLISAFSTVAGVISSAGGVIALLTNPITIAIAAIAGIIAIGVALYKNWDKIKEVGGKLKDGLVNTWTALRDGTAKLFGGIKDAMVAPIEKAKEIVQGIVDKIKDIFNFDLEFPDIKIPDWVPFFGDDEEKKAKDNSGSGRKPQPSKVKFFAKGGYMSNPTEFARDGSRRMIGGEAGGEGIVPLEGKHMKPIAEEIANLIEKSPGGGDINNYFNISSMVVREEADIRRIAIELENLQKRINRTRGAY